MKLIAQDSISLPPINKNPAGLGGFATITSPGETLATLISNVLGFLTIIAGLWFMANFILGGITWISAGGDKGKQTQAKDKLTNSVIGLAIVVAAYTISGLLSAILGINFLNLSKALSVIAPSAVTPTPGP